MKEINTIVILATALVSTIKFGELKRLDIQSFSSLDVYPFIGYLTIGDIREEYSDYTVEYIIHPDGTVLKNKWK